MKPTKHTPGPWRIGDAGNTIFGPPQGLPPIRIADLSYTKNRHTNARLIAAAPDLLAACEELIAEFETTEREAMQEPGVYGLNTTGGMEMALAAIAKAKGVTP